MTLESKLRELRESFEKLQQGQSPEEGKRLICSETRSLRCRSDRDLVSERHPRSGKGL